jgi:hypothetical protein
MKKVDLILLTEVRAQAGAIIAYLTSGSSRNKFCE